MKTIIAVPDFTRAAHLKKVLPPLLKGLDKKNTEIIIATGLHRAPTKKEIRLNLGKIAGLVKISVHNHRKNSVAYFGKSRKGIPVYLNKKLKNADRIISVGVVEPHLYAGYSGGTKVIAIGLAGEETINATHHPRFLERKGTRLAQVTKNPFQDFINEVSSFLPIKYSINIVNDKNGKLLKIFKGSPYSSFKKAVKFAQKRTEQFINKYFDALICDIPSEKGINMYQASRAFNYVINTRTSILKNGGIVLVKATLSEGFGKGFGEKRFMKTMLKMKNPKKTIIQIKKTGCLAGEHRAYMIAKALTKARLGFITNHAKLYKKIGLPFLFFKNLNEAKAYLKKSKIYYLKNPFSTILIKNSPI